MNSPVDQITQMLLQQIRYTDGINDAVDDDVAGLLQLAIDRVNALVPAKILPWVESNIYPPGAELPVTLDGYQIEPLQAQVDAAVDEVIITGPEQFGKSLTYQAAMIYKLEFTHGPKMIAYEEKTKAYKINTRQFIPMVKKVESLARQLDAAGTKAIRETIEFAGCFMDFYGAGADFTSNNYRDAAGDEYDTWPLTFEKKRAQLDNMRKRLRTWRQRGEACLVVCSSPKGTTSSSPTWLEFAGTIDADGFRRGQSSMGVWHLRCLGCGGLTIDSTQIDAVRCTETNRLRGGLRWAKDKHGLVVPDSLRVMCPVCDYEAVQAQMQEMNDAGGYVHMFPEIITRRGFNFGGLSCPRALSLAEIADMRMLVRGSNDFELERTYHNSFRGVAMPETNAVDDERERIILSHCWTSPDQGTHQGRPYIEADDVVALIGAADTQESPWGWYWVVRAMDKDRSTYPVACGFAHSEDELERALCSATYFGRQLNYAIIDQGGTNAEAVKRLAEKWEHVWQYKGDARSDLWRHSRSKEQYKLINCNADQLQVMLLREIYDQHDRSSSYWYLWPQDELPRTDDKAFDYITNMLNVRNTGQGRDSQLRQNWDVKNKGRERRDYFDCEKMMLVLPLVFAAQFDQMVLNGGATGGVSLKELQEQRRRERGR